MKSEGSGVSVCITSNLWNTRDCCYRRLASACWKEIVNCLQKKNCKIFKKKINLHGDSICVECLFSCREEEEEASACRGAVKKKTLMMMIVKSCGYMT